MTRLRVFSEDNPREPLATHRDADAVAAGLAPIGVRFERWETRPEIRAGDAPEQVLEAYRSEIDRLMAEGGYQSADVVSMHPDHPDKATMRTKFLDEHSHAEDEVRFFVDGAGLFTLHVEDRVYEVRCERGDLIGVPSGTRHWFDMGANPSFVAVRIFTSPDGWAADFTGSDIAGRFPRLED
ncbi:MAG: cupin domain-containing protein [Gammaproteobacteria bacterium]|nr:MAG: cupin domain-containing protein [Gammaproteobacteria bacterium]